MKIKVAAVSYTNTYPFIYGIHRFEDELNLDLKLAYPAQCADWLVRGEVDMGLVPVATLLKMPKAKVLDAYCIGADGPVDTVCLYSQVPIDEVDHLYLDYQSRTSVLLCKILLKYYLKLNPQLIPAEEGFIDKIEGKTAGLVIGDRAFQLNDQFPYVYDLAALWKDFTGLPFVFAAWISPKPLAMDFITRFKKAMHWGLNHKAEAIASFHTGEYPDSMMLSYLNERIDYDLNQEKNQALKKFLALAKEF